MAQLRWLVIGLALFALVACGDDESTEDGDASAEDEPIYVLASVVIDPDDNRTTYVQTITSLEDEHFDNDTAIELPGNGVVLAHGRDLFVGHAEEPTWVRYSLTDDRAAIEETGRLSLLNTGATYVDYGNAIVDDETAVTVLSAQRTAVIWNPKTMEIVDEVELDVPEHEGYELEVWTTVAHDGLVYIPLRWADWEGARVYPSVGTIILDPHAHEVVGRAEDDRCASGGRVVIGADGYAYVMGDGRNYAIQMFANALGEDAPANCLLRIAPGETDFDPDFFHTIASLTGGLESITELESPVPGSGTAFAKMFYPNELPDDIEPVDFAFWDERAHKMWRIELGDEPMAREVDDIPFSAIGFDGSVIDGRLYTGESLDSGATSDIYEIDPDTNAARPVFTMDGYFNGLFRLE